MNSSQMRKIAQEILSSTLRLLEITFCELGIQSQTEFDSDGLKEQKLNNTRQNSPRSQRQRSRNQVLNFDALIAANCPNDNITDVRDLKFWFYSELRDLLNCTNFMSVSRYLHFVCDVSTGILSHSKSRDVQVSEEFLKIYELTSNFDFDESKLSRESAFRLFMCLGFSVGYFYPHEYKVGHMRLSTRQFDSEYLKSFLFGSWVSIDGLDHLFGGGGPYLFSPSMGQPGRVILIEGSYGNGKSTLALSIATDVARKGGIAWLVPFEQSSDECLINIDNLSLSDSGSGVSFIDNFITFRDFIGRSHENKGGSVVFLSVTTSSWKEAFSDMKDVAEQLSGPSCRCVLIDPINAISDSDTASGLSIRNEFHSMIGDLRKCGVNVILVAESSVDSGLSELSRKIADVVLRLTVEDVGTGYLQRFLEIAKSRLQREQRGQHPFSIISRSGIRILPSSASVAARIRQRELPSYFFKTHFGWRSFDNVIGNDAFTRGDVIVFTGPTGTLKTELAVIFASGTDSDNSGRARSGACSIYIPLRDTQESLQMAFKREEVLHLRGEKGSQMLCKVASNVDVVKIPVGFTQPGHVFRVLEDKISGMRRRGMWIDRIVFDNAEQFDLSCPFISSDPVFALTLLEFCRRRGITALFAIHRDHRHGRIGDVANTIINSADLHVDFEKVAFRGGGRIVFRALKSRGMLHRPEFFDLSLSDGTLTIGTRSRLLRIDEDGGVSAVPIRLYLHGEGSLHSDYNRAIASALRPVLSHDIKEVSDDRTNVFRSLALGGYSTVDELQVLQVDEFQLPDLCGVHNSKGHLFPLPVKEFDKEVFRFSEQERTQDILGTTFALPYYQNIGVLAFRKSLQHENLSETPAWRTIAKFVRDFESSSQSRSRRIVFDFACDKDETYNCLFFEIALGLGFSFPRTGVSVGQWLRDNKPHLSELIYTFSLLGYRAHKFHPGATFQSLSRDRDGASGGIPDESAALPLISRHWFTTACEFLSSVDPSLWKDFLIHPIEASVSGEWYLAIPEYSSSPEVGIEVLRMMHSKSEEVDRLRRGVGLPVRRAFYREGNNEIDLVRCHYFSMPGRDVVRSISNSLRRSNFYEYSETSPVLSFCLKQILEDSSLWIARGGHLDRAASSLIKEL